MAARFRTAGRHNPGATDARCERADRAKTQLQRAERRRKDDTLTADLQAAGDAVMFPLSEKYENIVNRAKALVKKHPDELGPCKVSTLKIIEAAVCGATHDPFATDSKDRERLRAQLHGLERNAGRDAAAKSLVQGSPFATDWDRAAESLAGDTSGHEVALNALMPEAADPYRMGGPCDCTEFKRSHVAHSNFFAECRQDPSCRFRTAQREFISQTKLLVQEAQALSVAVQSAACLAAEGEVAEAKATANQALLSRLDMKAQRQSQAPRPFMNNGTLDSFVARTPTDMRTQAQHSHASLETIAAIERAVEQELELLARRLQSGAPTTATSYRFRCPKAVPGAEPMGARPTILSAIDAYRAETNGYAPVRSSKPPMQGVTVVCGVPMLELPVPEESTEAVMIDFDHPVCLMQLRARGQTGVPCHRPGCKSRTKPLTGNKAYSVDSRGPWLTLSADGAIKVGASRKS